MYLSALFYIMENTTKISELPENTISQFPSGNNYIPINVHPNPYGNSNNSDNGKLPPYFDKSTSTTTPPIQEYQRLPSKDIRIDESIYTQDKEITANYIPPISKNMKDYLAEQENEIESNMIEKHKKNKKRVHFADEWFEKFKMPILICCLFFIFQMSFFHKIMEKISELSKMIFYISFFKEDGNIKLQGNIFKSILFGVAYFALIHLNDYWGV